MGKYDKFHQAPQVTRKFEIHPIWRGIGCLLLLIIPVISYAGAVLLVEANQANGWLPISGELARTIVVPGLGPVRYLLANLVVTVLLSLIGFGLITVLYMFAYRIMGPPQLGPLDAPPIRKTRRRRA